MELLNKKCSFKEHEEINAIVFCQECKVYMCNKCENFHSKLLQNHHILNLEKDMKETFTGICTENNHPIQLNYFCKSHNKLCCAACISKIKDNENGQHKDCDVCKIEEIKEEKKKNLVENINILKNLSNTFEDSIKELKKIFEKISKNKEELKIEIQKIFTKLRNELNDREDKLLFEVDDIYDKVFFKEEMIKESEKLPDKIKLYLEKGNLINKEWNDEKIGSIINDCINIENNISYINKVKKEVEKCNSIKVEIRFVPEENKINEFLEAIKAFGEIQQIKQIVEKEIKPMQAKVIKPLMKPVQPIIQNEIQPIRYAQNVHKRVEPVIHRQPIPQRQAYIQPIVQIVEKEQKKDNQ